MGEHLVPPVAPEKAGGADVESHGSDESQEEGKVASDLARLRHRVLVVCRASLPAADLRAQPV